MMNAPSTSLLLSFSLALGATACGGSQPTDEEYDDIASSTAALVSEEPAGEAEAANDAMTASRGGLPAALTKSGSGHLQGRRGAIDYTIEVTCSDNNGVELASCEGADGAHLLLTWDGSFETVRRSGTVHRTGDWTLTGLSTDVAELNGSGTFHIEGDFQALLIQETRTYEYDYAATYEAVKISTADRKIQSGHAVYHISGHKLIDRVHRDIERSFDVTADVTFLGDGKATIVLDNGRTYDVDVKNGLAALRNPAR